MVRATLAIGGHVRSGASASGYRDATAVVGVGDPSNNTGAVGAVFARDVVRASVAPGTRFADTSGRLVCQDCTNLR